MRPIMLYGFPGDEEKNFDWQKSEKGEWAWGRGDGRGEGRQLDH